MKKNFSKLLALYLPYILLGLAATNFGEAWRLAEGKELGDKIMSMMGTVPLAFANPLPSLHLLDILVGLCCGAGLRLAVYLRGKNAKKYRHGMEYGSARWGTQKDIEPFEDPVFANNVILTRTERLMMSNRPPDPKNARNKNVLVVGGSGSGKTRFWLKPNLLQCHSSYVVTDPKGSIVVECGNALLKNGYKLKILNTINFSKSMHYNPFSYVHSEKDILKLVTTLMTNTKGDGSGGDPFWEKSERLLLTALIAYLHYEAPKEEQNFSTLLEMLNTMQVSEDDEDFQNPVDLLFEDLAKRKPNSFAGRQYKLYKLAAGKTAKSILISCGARLAPFDIQELRDRTMYDELELDMLGDRKTALFLIMSDTDSTFNFLISMVYTQLFNLLCDKADDVYGGKVSYRDGHYFVFDGQHTIVTRRAMNGGQDLPIICKVYEGLTEEEEAMLFSRQTGVSTPLTAGAELRAALVGKDPESLAFVKATESTGLQLGLDSYRAPWKIICIRTAFKEYKTYGADLYKEALTMLARGWEGDPDSLRSGILQGMMRFVALYQGEYDPERLVKRLHTVHPMTLVRDEKSLSGTVRYKYMMLILRTYNGASRRRNLPIKP